MKFKRFKNWSIAGKVLNISLATVVIIAAVNFLYLLPSLERRVLAAATGPPGSRASCAPPPCLTLGCDP